MSAQYPALRKTPDATAEHALIELAALGGTLLVVHHDVEPGAHEGEFDPADYVLPPDVGALLDEGWRFEVDELRPRTVSGGAGARHTHDRVLRARWR